MTATVPSHKQLNCITSLSQSKYDDWWPFLIFKIRQVTKDNKDNLPVYVFHLIRINCSHCTILYVNTAMRNDWYDNKQNMQSH